MLRIDDLAGKSILITGASSGIGAALSRAFAEQGARLALHWNSNAAGAQRVLQSVRDAGSVAELIQGDLTRDGEARRLVESSAAALGGLDVLINNAGSLVSRRPFLEADDIWVDGVFDLNARAVIHSCQAAVPHLQRRGGAGIYGASKAFVHNLTRHLAREFAAQNIRVNTVSPGVIDTPFHSATPPERMEVMRQSVSMRRIGTPGDCVGAFLFLASRTLSGYITGQNIHVNGGQVMP